MCNNNEPKLVDPFALEEDEDAFKAKKDLWSDIFYRCPDAADLISDKYKELGESGFTMFITETCDESDIRELEIGKKIISKLYENESNEEMKGILKDIEESFDIIIQTKKFLRDQKKKETV